MVICKILSPLLFYNFDPMHKFTMQHRWFVVHACFRKLLSIADKILNSVRGSKSWVFLEQAWDMSTTILSSILAGKKELGWNQVKIMTIQKLFIWLGWSFTMSLNHIFTSFFYLSKLFKKLEKFKNCSITC